MNVTKQILATCETVSYWGEWDKPGHMVLKAYRTKKNGESVLRYRWESVDGTGIHICKPSINFAWVLRMAYVRADPVRGTPQVRNVQVL